MPGDSSPKASFNVLSATTQIDLPTPENFLIVTVTRIEALEVFKVFHKQPERARHIVNGNSYYDLGLHGGMQIFLARSEKGDNKFSGLLLSMQQAIRDLCPQAVIVCGIAYGLRPDKQKLGDILIAKQLVYYDPLKVDHNSQIPNGDRIICSEWILQRAQRVKKWSGGSLHYGLVLSGEMLVDNPVFLNQLLNSESEAIGIEIEGAELYAAAQQCKANWALIQGICNWPDGRLNVRAQVLAAANAAKFVLHVLEFSDQKTPKKSLIGKHDNLDEQPSLNNQSGQIVNGPQTNISGEVSGMVLSGTFGSVNFENINVHFDNRQTQQRIPFTVPPLPPHFVNRPKEIEALISLLLDNYTGVQVANKIALQGGGGFGKTTLAIALCHDIRIQKKFRDGIIWITLGENPNILGLLNDQIKLLDRESPISNDINTASTYFHDLLRERNLLIVLDDVWDVWHARQFLEGKENCAKVITTRRLDITVQLRFHSTINVYEMHTTEAMQILINWLDTSPVNQEPFIQFARELGEWPLLLELAGAQLRELVTLDRQTPEEALETLRTLLFVHGFTAFDRADEFQRNSAIRISLEVSLRRIGKDRERFYELAIFAKDVDIPIDAIIRLWGQTANLTEVDAQNVFRIIQRLSLFSFYSPEQKTIRLHDVICALLSEQRCDELPALHQKLLAAYRLLPAPTNPAFWGELTGKEIYLWDNLAYHLIQAGFISELISTVKDLTYLMIKTRARGAFAVEADLRIAEKYAPEDEILSLLCHAFANMMHLLNDCISVSDTGSILFSRLRNLPALKEACDDFETFILKPYITQFLPLPDLPGPFVARTIHPYSSYNDIVFAPNNKWLVFRSDNTLIIQDILTGITHLAIEMPNSGYTTAIAVSPDSKYVIRLARNVPWNALDVWDIENGTEKMSVQFSGTRPYTCKMSPDGKYIFVVDGGKLKTWEVDTGKPKHFLVRKRIFDITIDGRWILSKEYLKTNEIIDSSSGEQKFIDSFSIITDNDVHKIQRGLTDFELHKLVVSNNQWLVTNSFKRDFYPHSYEESSCSIWEISSEKKICSLPGEAVGISSDSKKIITAAKDGITIWDSTSWKAELVIRGYGEPICTNPSGDLIVAQDDRTAKILNTNYAKSKHFNFIKSQYDRSIYLKGFDTCSVSSTNNRLITSSGISYQIWDSNTGLQIWEDTFGEKIRDCRISRDGQKIVITSRNTAKILNAFNGIVERSIVIPEEIGVEIYACAISADKLSLVLVGYHFFCIYDINPTSPKFFTSPKVYQKWSTNSGILYDCAVSSNNHWVVVVGGTRYRESLRILDIETGAIRFRTRLQNRGFAKFANKCTISPNDQLVVVALSNGTLRMWKVWNIESPEELLTLSGHTGPVMSCAISSDSKKILSVSDVGELKVWNVQSGNCIATFLVDDYLKDCAFHPDGKRIIAVGKRGIYWLKLVE